MTYRLVTCPESTSSELIEYHDTPCGMLIVGCSSFRPPCVLNCPRTCAARFDQRNRELAALGLDESTLEGKDFTSVDVFGALRTG